MKQSLQYWTEVADGEGLGEDLYQLSITLPLGNYYGMFPKQHTHTLKK